MAQPTTIRFGKFKIYVEDPDRPGTYIAPCGLTEKSLNLNFSAQEDLLPDCDNPDAPAWVGRAIASISAEFSGSGVFAVEDNSYGVWRRLGLAGQSFNVRIVFDHANGGYYAGAAVMTQLGHATAFGERVRANVAGASDGAWTWTTGPDPN